MKKLYCFVGLPCSGKSYTAKLIASKLANSTYIATGDIARELMTTQDLKDKTAASDLFPLEDLMRATLTKRIEDAPAGPVIVDGFPRFDGQANFMIDSFWIYHPTVIEINVGDQITLFNRAKMRGRDTDMADFGTRLATAQKNMSGVFDVLNRRLVQRYTISGGDDTQIFNTFKRYTK